jgi:hypothetical protein
VRGARCESIRSSTCFASIRYFLRAYRQARGASPSFQDLNSRIRPPRRIVLHPKRRSGMKNTFRVSPPKLSFVVTRLFQQPHSRYDYACQSVATPCRRRIWNAVDGHGSAFPFQCLCAGSTGKAGSSWNSVPCSTKAVEEHSLRYGVLCRCGRKYHWKYRFRPWQNRSSFDAKYPC